MDEDDLRNRRIDAKLEDTGNKDYSFSAEQIINDQLVSLQPKWKNFVKRFIFGVLMFSSFAAIIMSGPVIIILLIVGLQLALFNEIIKVGHQAYKFYELPWFRCQSWFFILWFNYFMLGDTVFKHFAIPLRLFGWTLITAVFCVIASHCAVMNVLHGLIWFALSTTVIICNDSAAYFCGFFFGKTPLIHISPKKTWEGYIGGALLTVVYSIIATFLMIGYDFMIAGFDFSFSMYPFLTHSIVIAIFASIVAPFGGFFASGFKRAYKIKDFGAIIPGHGGVTDRFDCQFLMMVFVYVYYTSVISFTHVNHVIATFMDLDDEGQLQLYNHVKSVLVSKNILNSTLT